MISIWIWENFLGQIYHEIVSQWKFDTGSFMQKYFFLRSWQYTFTMIKKGYACCRYYFFARV